VTPERPGGGAMSPSPSGQTPAPVDAGSGNERLDMGSIGAADVAPPTTARDAGPVDMPPAADAAPMPPTTAPPDAAPAAGVVIRAMDIQADVVRARVVYANEIRADSGQIGVAHENPDEGRWEGSGNSGKIEQAEVVADVIYVKELRCKRIEVAEAFAKKIRIGAPAP
jgi:hypothetical protein